MLGRAAKREGGDCHATANLTQPTTPRKVAKREDGLQRPVQPQQLLVVGVSVQFLLVEDAEDRPHHLVNLDGFVLDLL